MPDLSRADLNTILDRHASYTAVLFGHEELPPWVVKRGLSENGGGSEDAQYIIVGDRVYSDAMEPEDARFSRDLKWIIEEINTAGQDVSALVAEVLRWRHKYAECVVKMDHVGIARNLAQVEEARAILSEQS